LRGVILSWKSYYRYLGEIEREVEKEKEERKERRRKRQQKDFDRRSEVGRSLYSLRDQDVGKMSPLLRSLIDAYRPHTEPDWENLTPLPVEESFTEEVGEYYFELKGYYPEEALEFTND